MSSPGHPYSVVLPATPDFASFAQLKAELLGVYPNLIDTTETRMARVLAEQVPDPATLVRPDVGYRCHVAEDWLAYFGLPASLKPQALVTQGVRHSLKTIFQGLAQRGARIALPLDVYPVYLQLAQDAGLSYTTYSTLDANWRLPSAEVALLTNPCKPKGSTLSGQELRSIQAWLAEDPTRRVLIDAVYTFEAQLNAATLALYGTGQAWVLHSLSKGWAMPLLAGIALIPEQDVADWTASFRALDVNRESLRNAQGLLRQDAGRPNQLAAHLRHLHEHLVARLSTTALAALLPHSPSQSLAGQYLFVLPCSWQDALKQGVLALPISVFGSTRQDLCVVSSLPEAAAGY